MTRYRKDSENREQRSSRLGAFGERAAAEYLKLRGYRIVALNFETAIGRNRKGVALKGEIDLIAVKDKMICFVEVKSRSAGEAPESAVTLRKQRQITRTARTFMRHFELPDPEFRFDVITVVERGNKSPQIRHFKNYWTSEKFRKRRWTGDPVYTR